MNKLTPKEMRSWMKLRKLSVKTAAHEAGLHVNTLYAFFRGRGGRLATLYLERYRAEKELALSQAPEPPHAA